MQKNSITLLIIFFLITVSNAELYSQNKIYQTSKLLTEVPKIDGNFNDRCWMQGEWEGGFTQNSPDNGAEPSQPTEFKILYDSEFIYVALKAYDSEPKRIDARMSRRDSWVGDRIAIEFDSYNDKRTSFIFCVSASGVKNDGVITREDGVPDGSIDFVWYVKTKITGYGWNAEMKIPFSQLRYNKDRYQTWGLEVVRFFFRNQEYDTWQHIPESISGWVANYGELQGIQNIQSKKQIEIAPYMLGRFESYEKEENNPYSDGSDFGFDVGLDGKIGITNDLTLDFAINPDFGQVEADPSVVNLTAFETYYQEKRPFFLEGRNITDYNLGWGDNDKLFYSRRIGHAPQGYPELGIDEYANIPDRTRILSAIKLTGKTKHGWSIGVLESLTNREMALINNNGKERKEAVEPFTNYFLGRIQKDFNKGNTILGGVITSVYRDINEKKMNFLNKSAITGGLDFTQYFSQRNYEFSANVSGSYIKGSNEAMLNQQMSSRRYFQRPDAEYISIDSGMNSMTGHSGTVLLRNNRVTGFDIGNLLTWRSPGFESNDIGYLRKADYILNDFWLGYRFTKPFSVFRRVSLELDIASEWDFGGSFNQFNINTKGSFNLRNFWSINYIISSTLINKQNTKLRGGPKFSSPGLTEYLVRLKTDHTKKLSFSAAVWEAYHYNNSGKDFETSLRITARLMNALSIYLYPKYGSYNKELQYVSQSDYNGEPRYILSKLNQEMFFLTVRFDYNITPDLTIQYYGSPFVSGGLYNNFKRVDNPSSKNYNERTVSFLSSEVEYIEDGLLYNFYENSATEPSYSIYNPDFNFKEFRSNLVVRWEYKAGSTLYFVWAQNRTSITGDGTFDLSSNFAGLFKLNPHDVLMLKFTYRFMN